MRKEPIVFLVFAAFIGWKSSEMLGDTTRAPRDRAKQKEYINAYLPDVDLALADTSRDATFERDLFAPPSPTSPLPALPVRLPPLEPLTALAPPTGWGPAPAHYGKLLRQPVMPANASEEPGLFAIGAADDVEAGEEEAAEVLDLEELPDDPDARAARIAGFKKQFDWIYLNSFRFGRILNEDRYTLDVASGPEIDFLELDPATGAPRFGASVKYGPDRYDEFGLVDSPLTTIEVGFAKFGDPLLETRMDAALAFAERCLLLRNETPRALEVAAELFRRAEAVNTQDSPRPRLGLARTMELGFQLDQAFEVYQDLLTSGHESNPSVHARLGSLYATLRMDGMARTSFETALKIARTDWEARLRFGEFLSSLGLHDQALEHLREAVLREPKAPEDKPWRVEIRLANAGALLAAGRVDEAFDAFATAVSADQANEVGRRAEAEAGQLSAARLSKKPAAKEFLAAAGTEAADGSFDVLLAQGLLAMDQGRWEESAQALALAVNSDPFRAHEALRALSRLAEITGNPEDAATFASDALSANPSDPWTLFQLGRLAERDGDEGQARNAYRAALDLELDFAPALERMGALLHDAGEHEAAERYYDRAVSIEPDAAAVWSRRGWNALSLDQLDLARTSFDEARRLQPTLESARAGLAWWNYASGETEEAITLFGEIVDDRRAVGEEDRVVRYAEATAAAIKDNDAKEVFRDRFDRTNGRVGNGWTLDQGFGPLADLVEGHVEIQGNQDRGGRTRVFRSLPPDRFIAFSAEITVGPEAKGTRVGLFISSERLRSGGASEVQSEITISRSRDGDLQVRVLKAVTDEEAVQRTVNGPVWPIGEPINVAIERTGDDLDSAFTVYVDGEPVAAGLESDRLTASRTPVNFGVFVEGETGRRADVSFDNVRVVRRK
ncbi:tetratricopeptide repeat protein [Planctomycetes bacterium Poly30]|uniref:Tetratricopeptide repeat protein n=1 Tax=Saltatorellus ferox TaxID=2528018 RepID=A0A518EQU7_9BACT|nr:tetratricopeptide repeat protein [Planctomycetes bacterium Poly30]